MMNEKTLTLIIRILEECLENDYSAEELQSRIRDILRLLNAHPVETRSAEAQL